MTLIDLQRQRKLVSNKLEKVKILEIKLKLINKFNQKLLKSIDLVTTISTTSGTTMSGIMSTTSNDTTTRGTTTATHGTHSTTTGTTTSGTTRNTTQVTRNTTSNDTTTHGTTRNDTTTISTTSGNEMKLINYNHELKEQLDQTLFNERFSFVQLHQKAMKIVKNALLVKQKYLESTGVIEHQEKLSNTTFFFDALDDNSSSTISACNKAKMMGLERVKEKILVYNQNLVKEKDDLMISENNMILNSLQIEMNEKWEIFIQAQKQLDLALEALQKDLNQLQIKKDTLLREQEKLISAKKSLQENIVKFEPSLSQFDAFRYMHITNKSKSFFEWDWSFNETYQSLRSLFTKELFSDYGVECSEMQFDEFFHLCQILQAYHTFEKLDFFKEKIDQCDARLSLRTQTLQRLDSLLDLQDLYYASSYLQELDELLINKFSLLGSKLGIIKNQLVPDLLTATSTPNCKDLIQECMDILV